MRTRRTESSGVSLITTLIGLAVFVIIGVGTYSGILSLYKLENTYREEAVIASLADQYSEYARNLPYSQVGTINGNPPGSLPDLLNAASSTVNGRKYLIYYEVTYMDDPADGTILAGTDPAPNDYKQLKVNVKNTVTNVVTTFTTNIVPKGLENLANGGALYIKVFDAVGQPVQGASVNIVDTALNPDINLNRTTDAAGNWIEVGLPDDVSHYHIVVTKNGYSSDQTYPSTGGNPNPTKPDATISNGVVTQVSFSIDKLSSLTYNLVNSTCSGLSGVGLEMRGSKLIGTPSVYKFDQTYTTDGSGVINLPTLEWDNYTPAITSLAYMIYGSNPIQQISILPGVTQTSTLILGPSTANSLLVIVKDASTGNPIENAAVRLKSTSPSYDTTHYTEGSIWNQQDWSGGSGQALYTVANKYFADDAHVDTLASPTGLRLKKTSGNYALSGYLESSTFDTGTGQTGYTTLDWSPTSQGASTTLKFQIAANTDNATWNYLGPDGTSATYYTVPGTTINATSTNKRYVRYKAYLSTIDTSVTPVLSSLNLNYVSGCAAPGQAMFAGLSSGSNYQVIVSMPGYATSTLSNVNISGYNTLQVNL